MYSSMFGGDPFFMDPFEQMDRMMSSFQSPLMNHPMMPQRQSGLLQLDHQANRRRQLAVQGFPPSPFGDMMGGMSSMHNMMRNMQRNMMSLDSFPSMGGSHSFQSSTVIMQNDRNGPRVIQSSSSSRLGPDGVKETRQSHKDSGTGEMRMSVGHHIRDRAHIIEKSKNRRTGDEEENQEYINIEEEEAESFNNEWMQKMSSPSSSRQQHHRSVMYHHPGTSRHEPYSRHHRRRPHTAAITYRPTDDAEVQHRQHQSNRNDTNQ